MIRQYIKAAMANATSEILSDNGTVYCEIPVCPGVYANAKTEKECHAVLEEVLEEWLLVRIWRRLPIPEVDGVKIEVKRAGGRLMPPFGPR